MIGEIKRIITESQLIHLNDVAVSIVEAKEKSDSQEAELLKKIIDNHVIAATEIVRLLKYINNETKIKERRLYASGR